MAIVASCALLYFSLDSILLENIFQFYCSLALHALITAYVIWHYLGNGDDLGVMYNRISLWVMVGVCTFQLAYLLLAYPVKETFGWRLYKKIGGNVAIRPLYRTASIFFSLMKLDFALGVILVLLAIFYLLTDAVQIALNVLACVVTLGWLLLGFAFVQRESRRLAPWFFLFATLEPAFLIYKLVAMKLDNGNDENITPDGPNPSAAAGNGGGVVTVSSSSSTNDGIDPQYPVFSWNEFLLTGCFAVIVRIACIVTGYFCYGNFGMGLKEKIWNASLSTASASTKATGVTGGQQHVTHVASGVNGSMHHGSALNHVAYSSGHPVVVVQDSSMGQDRSMLRNYIQPLL